MDKHIIDISTYQTITDIEQLKKSCDGVMLRIGFTGYGYGVPTLDNHFNDSFTKLKNAGVDIGVYYFSLASDEKMVDQETKWVIDTLAEYEKDGFRFTLPICVDCESQSNGTYGQKWMSLSNVKRSELMVRWMDNISKAGYCPMIYAGVSSFKHNTFIVNSFFEKYYRWVAQYYTVCQYDGVAGVNYAMWQYASDGKGIEYGLVSNNRVDLNHLYVDFPALIKEKGLNHIIQEEPQPKYVRIHIGNDIVTVPCNTKIAIEYC